MKSRGFCMYVCHKKLPGTFLCMERWSPVVLTLAQNDQGLATDVKKSRPQTFACQLGMCIFQEKAAERRTASQTASTAPETAVAEFQLKLLLDAAISITLMARQNINILPAILRR